MKLFDHIFYRLAKLFYKTDGIDSFRAVGFISITQCVLIGDLLFFILRIIFGLSKTALYARESKFLGVVIALILLVVNYLRYKRNYWNIINQWREKESISERRIRGFLVVIALVLPWIIFIWMATPAYRQ